MMLKHILLTVLLVLLSACGSSPDVCGDGTEIEHEDRAYCVYNTEAITEEGFRCPDAFQFEFQFREFTACGASGATPPASFEQFVHERLGLIPNVGSDAGADPADGSIPTTDPDSGTDATDGETVLTATLPILETFGDVSGGEVTGCIRYENGSFSATTTTFDTEGNPRATDPNCVFIFYESLGVYDEIYPDFFLISTDAWFIEMEGLTSETRPTSMKNPRDYLSDFADNFQVPGAYPFRLYAEDTTRERMGDLLESGVLEAVSYDAETRAMVFRLEVNP